RPRGLQPAAAQAAHRSLCASQARRRAIEAVLTRAGRAIRRRISMFYPGVSIITLAVRDVARSRAFYERLGWRCSRVASAPECAFFQLNNVALALFDQSMFDEETGAAAPPGHSGARRSALAQNHGSPASVDAALRKFT